HERLAELDVVTAIDDPHAAVRAVRRMVADRGVDGFAERARSTDQLAEGAEGLDRGDFGGPDPDVDDAERAHRFGHEARGADRRYEPLGLHHHPTRELRAVEETVDRRVVAAEVRDDRKQDRGASERDRTHDAEPPRYVGGANAARRP